MLPKITIFTKPNCPGCVNTKLYLRSKGVPFIERDVAAEPEALAFVTGELGFKGAPVVYVEGASGDTAAWSDYRHDQLKELVRLYKAEIIELSSLKEAPAA